MNKKNSVMAIGLILLLSALLNCYATETAQPPLNWKNLQTLAIQKGGRVMPLDSFARITLLQLSGRQSLKVGKQRLSAIQWLTEVLLRPHEAEKYKVFLVENPEVLQELQIPYKKPRDVYAYATLFPKIEIIRQFALKADMARKSNAKVELVPEQMGRLYHNLMTLRSLMHTFAFWQVRDKLGEHQNISIADYFSQVFEKWSALQKDSEKPETKEQLNKIHGELKKLQDEVIRPLYQLHNDAFAIFPSTDVNETQTWKTPWDVFFSAAPKDTRREILWTFGRLYHAYQKSEWSQSNDYIRKLHQNLVTLAQKQGQYRAIPLEVVYNQFDPFFYALIIYILSTILCCLSWMGWGRNKFYGMALVLLMIAFLIQTSGIMMRIVIKARPPVATLYESILFVSWMGVLLSFALEYFSKKSKSLGLFIGSLCGNILLFIAGRYAVEGDNMAVLMAVLDSNFWLATHVTTITIGYSACLVAGGLGHIFVFLHFFPQEVVAKHRKDVYRMIYGSLCFALPMAFLGTILGGIWADQSWGRFWGWDPKENGALLIVLWNALMLHARFSDWGLALAAIFGNIIVAAAWWGVNLLNIGLHSYGFHGGLATNLLIFFGLEMIILILGALLSMRSKKV